MSQYNAQKNPPWARPNEFGNQPQQATMPQQMMNPNVMQYQQQALPAAQQASVYQAQLAMQQQALTMQQFVANNAQQMYNPAVTGMATPNVGRPVNAVGMMPGGNSMMQSAGTLTQGQGQTNASSGGAPSKQRVFTGTVTKVVDTYGFVDEDVFFQMSCVKGPHPVLHDRVLVEAVCLPTMPFKWNATRVQVLPMNEGGGNSNSRKRSPSRRDNYSAVPPPGLGDDLEPRRDRDRERDRSRGRSPDLEERRRRRERREREDKEKEARVRSRSRSRSPRRARQSAPARKYRVRIPEFSLDVSHFSVNLIKSRYSSMYIPSDFFAATARWTENFPQHRPLDLAGLARFHVMDKDVEPVFQRDDVVEPPDADFLYSAKVMLLSIPGREELLKRCVQQAEDKESSRPAAHPARLIDCLVGVNSRGKNEYMAIGGPWSPSLDGEDPQRDPAVLIKTAVRCCRALTGVDLSAVTRWYRFAELHYHRAKTTYKSRDVPARVETVVIYAPDVWSVMPSGLEWDGLHLNYQRALDKKLAELGAEPVPAAATTPAEDEKEGDASVEVKEPTHWSKLDLRVIKVNELREELAARNMSPKGLRLQLIARLSKVLKQEQEQEEDQAKLPVEPEVLAEEQKKVEDDKKAKEKGEKEKEKDSKEKEKERAALLEKYKLPETPQIIVHPCRKAKSGKFNCKVVCLSLLLDYTQDINKEHTFEVSLFAENFNEMLMRDFGLQIYKALSVAPEKTDEKAKDKDKKEKEKADDKEKKEKADDKEKKEKSEEKDKKEKSEEKDGGDDVKRTEALDGEDSKDASEKATVNGKDDDDDDKRKRRRGGKKRERIPLRTINPELLLAFSYFDTTHYGKMAASDVEELLQTLGLHLSRAQIKKLVSKVTYDTYLDYRKLTDTPIKPDKDKEETETEVEKEKTLAEVVLAASSALADDLGNRQLLPSFTLTPLERKEESPAATPAKRGRRAAPPTPEKTDAKPEPLADGFVAYKGTLLNVDNLNEQLKKNETARLKAEEKSLDLSHNLSEVKDKLEGVMKQLKDSRQQLAKSQKKLEQSNENLQRELISSEIYLTTLMDIQERVLPILDTDEMKRLVTKRQQLLGAPQINLVPLTKIEDIVMADDVEMEDVTNEPKLEVKTEIKSESAKNGE